jgi:chemotaxis protein MotA
MAANFGRKGRIDIGTLAGVLIAGVALVGGIILDQGRVSDIFQGTAALIVFGGTFGAVLVSTPLQQVIEAIRSFQLLLFQPEHNLSTTTVRLVEFATKARRQGIISLEEEAESIDDPVFRRTLELAIDGLGTDEIRKMLESGVNAQEARADDIARVYEAAGGYAPTIGIIGAVLGLIQVMKNLSNIDEVGRGIAVAFVATIYGVASANLFFLPAAAKIRNHALRRSESMHLIGEGIVGIVEGMNPKMLSRKLNPLSEPRSGGAAPPPNAPEGTGERVLL